MTHAERRALREKHQVCEGCEVIKVLDYLDVVDPMPTEINWQGGK